MSKVLHIVTHEPPFPVAHGGLIDIFNKIVWLHKLGLGIHLHCYTIHHDTIPELEQYCLSVNYYQRKTGLKNISLTIPYIVNSRRCAALEERLLQDNHPILFEGMHTTLLVYKERLNNRGIFVRLFNVETKYYNSLAKNELNFVKRFYYQSQSNLLKQYENKIAALAHCLALSTEDEDYFQKEYNAKKLTFLPVFTSNQSLESLTGKGTYCLYQGNLTVNENKRAVEFLAKEVFDSQDFQFIIAGKEPDKNIMALQKNVNIKVIANPGDPELKKLIKNAHINVLPSFNDTGVKLKLLNALFLGRHCLVNPAGVHGSGLDCLCEIATDARSFKNAIHQLMAEEFTKADIDKREKLLTELYNNEINALKLSELVH